jgi:hypothetical protein
MADGEIEGVCGEKHLASLRILSLLTAHTSFFDGQPVGLIVLV